MPNAPLAVSATAMMSANESDKRVITEPSPFVLDMSS
jgi:hypothetical protein